MPGGENTQLSTLLIQTWKCTQLGHITITQVLKKIIVLKEQHQVGNPFDADFIHGRTKSLHLSTSVLAVAELFFKICGVFYQALWWGNNKKNTKKAQRDFYDSFAVWHPSVPAARTVWSKRRAAEGKKYQIRNFFLALHHSHVKPIQQAMTWLQLQGIEIYKTSLAAHDCSTCACLESRQLSNLQETCI